MISANLAYDFDHQILDYRVLLGAIRVLHDKLATPHGGFTGRARQWQPLPL